MTDSRYPGYYAVIPAEVRYDKNLSDKAKLLYGEITALSNEKGYCWATNDYFAKLYGVHKKSISRLLSQLSNSGYIRIEIVRNDASEFSCERKIYIILRQKSTKSLA